MNSFKQWKDRHSQELDTKTEVKGVKVFANMFAISVLSGDTNLCQCCIYSLSYHPDVAKKINWCRFNFVKYINKYVFTLSLCTDSSWKFCFKHMRDDLSRLIKSAAHDVLYINRSTKSRSELQSTHRVLLILFAEPLPTSHSKPQRLL